MTKELKNLVKKKTKVWNTYLGAKSFSNWNFYRKIRNSVTNAVKIARLTLNTNLSTTCVIIRRPFGCQINSKDDGKCGRFENLQKWHLRNDQCVQNQYSK